MTDLDTRIQEAFDAVTMPPELKAQTLHYIKDTQTTETAEASAAEAGAVMALPEPALQQQGPSASSALPQQNPRPSVWQPEVVRSRTPQSTAAKKPAPFTRRFGLALAACLLLCAIGFGGFKAYTTETAFVDIDVNPSIELGVNMFDIVISAEPLNEDGAQVLSHIDLVGKSYNDAMDALLGSSAFLTYIDSTSFVGVSVVSDDERQSAALTTDCEQKLAMLPCKSACGQATHEEHDAAVGEGMGVGRYLAAQELIRLDPSVTMEDCRSMTMHELRSRIAALDPDSAYAAHGSEHSQGSGNGQRRGRGSH